MPFGTLFPIFGFDLKQPIIPQVQIFLNWQKKTNQSYWQLLPINTQPTNQPSPYSSYGIGLIDFADQLEITDTQVDEYLSTYPWAFTIGLHSYLSQVYQTDKWWLWPPDVKNREPQTLMNLTSSNYNKIIPHLKNQLKNLKIWQTIKTLANQNNIQIIGDLPFYIDKTSPLIWQFREAFEIQPDASTPRVSGVPISKTFPRQKWGHPLFDWNSPATELLWQMRLQFCGQLYNLTRIDHAIGFFHYGQMDNILENDLVVAGPSKAFLDRLFHYTQNNQIKLIAEDLTDFDTSRLRESLSEFGIPTMRVLTLSSSDGTQLDHFSCDPANFNNQTIIYTSNHDTPTFISWIESLKPETRNQLVSLYPHKTSSQKEFNLPSNKREQEGVLTDSTHLATRIGTNLPLTKGEQDRVLTNSTHLASHIRNWLIQNHSGITIIPIQDWLLTQDRINYPGIECPWQLNNSLLHRIYIYRV